MFLEKILTLQRVIDTDKIAKARLMTSASLSLFHVLSGIIIHQNIRKKFGSTGRICIPCIYSESEIRSE